MVNLRLINLAERLGNEVLPKEESPDPTPGPEESGIKGFENSIKLENLVCTDSGNGKVEHPVVYVAKDVVRNDQGSHVSRTPYDWIVYFEQNGLALPDFSLTCNILARLFRNKHKLGFDGVLMQYRDYGPGWGWHAQNTVVDWKGRRIIHYPGKEDFPAGSVPINLGRRRRGYSFNPEGFGDLPLDKALKVSNFEKYITDLTGLKDPQILIEIGEYFGRPAKVWVPNDPTKASYTSAAWLGCLISTFYIGTIDDLLYNDVAARGVLVKRR